MNQSTRSVDVVSKNIGGKRCPIVDTWWQTETGAIMITPLPGAIPTKPGSATLPFFGVDAAVVDKLRGEEVGAEYRREIDHPEAPGRRCCGRFTATKNDIENSIGVNSKTVI